MSRETQDAVALAAQEYRRMIWRQGGTCRTCNSSVRRCECKPSLDLETAIMAHHLSGDDEGVSQDALMDVFLGQEEKEIVGQAIKDVVEARKSLREAVKSMLKDIG